MLNVFIETNTFLNYNFLSEKNLEEPEKSTTDAKRFFDNLTSPNKEKSYYLLYPDPLRKIDPKNFTKEIPF